MRSGLTLPVLPMTREAVIKPKPARRATSLSMGAGFLEPRTAMARSYRASAGPPFPYRLLVTIRRQTVDGGCRTCHDLRYDR